jgi:hypothetical protein
MVGNMAHSHQDGRKASKPTFRFVPKELSDKCRGLIESFHAMSDYDQLVDVIWQSQAREVIDGHRHLTLLFADAAKFRGDERASAFAAIATAIISLEVLARDIGGWGRRLPKAKQKAEKLLHDPLNRKRIWLIDFYLYSRIGARRAAADAAATGTVTQAWN